MKLYQLANRLADRVGLEIRPSGLKSDFDPESAAIIRRVADYTMTTPERVYSLIQAVRYVAQAGIPGSIVECGVWRGGSMMAAAGELLRLGQTDTDLYLFDTYEGMTAPTQADVDYRGNSAAKGLDAQQRSLDSELWAYAPVDEVRRNLLSTGYDPAHLHFVKGDVMATLPDEAPATISLLRLDTDWYESTRHELVELYPRLSKGGVLILDDYGHWQGARKAVDEFIAEQGLHLLLNRIDNAGRLAIKTEAA